MAKEKYQSFWPLPGGVEGYVETLGKALAFVRENNPTERAVIEWFLSLPKVTRRKNAHSYVNTVLLHSGLFAKNGNDVRLSEDGEEYIRKPDTEFLLETLDKNVIGFRETMQILSRQPCDLKTLHSKLSDSLRHYQIKWTTAAGQPAWRVNWLRSMGLVAVTGHKFELTEDGKRIAGLMASPSPSAFTSEPVHKPGEEIPKPTWEVYTSLKHTEHLSSDPGQFEKEISNAFGLLGFEARHLGAPGETDVLAVAPLGRAQYSIVIDGKTTSREKVIEGQITWDTLLEHRDRHAAKYIAVVGPGFAGGDLIERARKHRVLLVPTDALIELLKIHERVSLSLEELEEPFSQIGVLNLDSCAKLAQVMANYAREVELLSKLIPKMLEIQRTEESTNIDVLRWALDKRFSTEEIRRALAFLGQAKAVSSSRNGNYIATMGPAALALKLRNIADAVQGR